MFVFRTLFKKRKLATGPEDIKTPLLTDRSNEPLDLFFKLGPAALFKSPQGVDRTSSTLTINLREIPQGDPSALKGLVDNMNLLRDVPKVVYTSGEVGLIIDELEDRLDRTIAQKEDPLAASIAARMAARMTAAAPTDTDIEEATSPEAAIEAFLDEHDQFFNGSSGSIRL